MSGIERVKVTEDVRNYAEEHGMVDHEALPPGLDAKLEEFAQKRSEVNAEA